MTLPVYDPALHPIGLGSVGGTMYGFLIANSYAKRMVGQPFQRASNVGTDELISTERQSVWTQSDYSGGEFFHSWSDEAGFSKCSGMMPNQLGTGVRTTPPLTGIWTGIAQAGVVPLFFGVIDGVLYVVYVNSTQQTRAARFVQLDSLTPPAKVDTIDLPGSKIHRCAFLNANSNRLWLGSNVPDVRTYLLDKTIVDPSKMWTHASTLKAPVVTSDPVTAIVGIHLMPPLKLVFTRHGGGDDDDRVWNHISGTGDNTKWDPVGVLPGQFVQAKTYNNAVYILTRSNSNETQISMTQGDNIFPVTDIPYYFRGECFVQYAGKLYVLGTGADLANEAAVGEMYEITGTSLRLVRTFLPETLHSDGKAMRHMRCGEVAEGLLWMPDSSTTGFEIYDAVTDGFFGGPALDTGFNADIQWTGVVPWGTSVFAWSSGATQAATGLYRTYQSDEDGPSYEPFIITSDFDVEPSREKLWGSVVVLSREVAPELDVSRDSGATWATVSAESTTALGVRYETVFDLSAIAPSRAIRLRFRFPMTGAAGEYPAEILSHSLSFLTKSSGKKSWSFTINGTEYTEQLNDQKSNQSPDEIGAQLWTWANDSAPLDYTDRDGTLYKVVISDFAEQQPQLTPEREAFFSVQLTEI